MSDAVTKAQFVIGSNTSALGLFGRRDEHLRMIEEAFDVQIVARGTELTVIGPKASVEKALAVLGDLHQLAEKRPFLTPQDVRTCLDMHDQGEATSIAEIQQDLVQVTARGKRISPRTVGQKRYVDAIRKNGIVFGIGPAGTGKTYLAMAMATAALKSREVNRLILTRPAVEAGESLGFLPGDLQDKVDPYLRPLYDALYDILGVDVFQRYMERGVIEVAPLAYMRGRTLDDAFIILDEAQNTTPEQMKMFFTRMGFGSKMVVTGDITQIDLPEGKSSGLRDVQEILKGVAGNRICLSYRIATSSATSWCRGSSKRTSDSRAQEAPGRGARLPAPAKEWRLPQATARRRRDAATRVARSRGRGRGDQRMKFLKSLRSKLGRWAVDTFKRPGRGNGSWQLWFLSRWEASSWPTW